MRRHTVSFKHAIEGILYVFRSQPNFQFHTVAALLVLVASWFLGVSRMDVIILLFTIMLVLIAEMLNTAIESMTDLISLERRVYAKIAKDVAAGMVLMAASLSVIIGVVVFLPYINNLF